MAELKEWPTGYTDTPTLPGSQWTVHDPRRPQPPVVAPGTVPGDAITLLGETVDAEQLDNFRSLDGAAIDWLITDSVLEVKPRSGDIRSVEEFASCQLHIEWRAPTEITATSQGRGNSGVFLMGLYEVQVLDGYKNPTYADGHTAAIYGQHPPLVNACVPPGSWHRYDIIFEAPTYAAGQLTQPAFLTVFHNGVLAHLRAKLAGPTRHRELASYPESHPQTGPVVLQDHRDRVQFRNLWVRRLERLEAP